MPQDHENSNRCKEQIIRVTQAAMLVEPAVLSCLAAIEIIRHDCVVHMHAAGIDQWDDIYPTASHFHRDCVEGNLFTLRNESGQIVGCATLDQRPSPEYASVNWLHRAEPIGIVHRLMISPAHQGRGYARVLMQSLEHEARRRGYQAIRLDAFLHNPSALMLYARLDYVRSGRVEFRKGPFACFEKRIL